MRDTFGKTDGACVVKSATIQSPAFCAKLAAYQLNVYQAVFATAHHSSFRTVKLAHAPGLGNVLPYKLGDRYVLCAPNSFLVMTGVGLVICEPTAHAVAPSPPPPPATQAHVIGHASASGDFATAIASGSAKHPHALSVRLFATPSQRVTGNWTVICSKGTGAGSNSGSFAVRASASIPGVAQVKLPTTNPDDCTVSASGALSASGRITVVLVAR